MRSSRWAVGFVLATAACGPGEAESPPRLSQDCDRLIRLANEELASMERDLSDDRLDDLEIILADMRKLARMYERLGEKIGRLDLNDRRLLAYADEYQRLALKAKNTVEAVVTGIEADDTELTMTGRLRFDEIVVSERALVRRINTHCGGDEPPADQPLPGDTTTARAP